MKLKLKRGTTGKLLRVFLQDSTRTDGGGLGGLTYNSAGLVWSYFREGDTAAMTVTMQAGTLGTWASGGFKEVDSTNMKGVYEIGVPDACLTSGGSVAMMLAGAANLVPCLIEIELDAVNYQDGAGFGLSGVNLNLAQTLGAGQAAGTVGRALQLARANARGKWSVAGDTLTLYDSDNVTVVASFALSPSGGPYATRAASAE